MTNIITLAIFGLGLFLLAMAWDRPARRRRARRDIRAIVMALRAYDERYGRLPIVEDIEDEQPPGQLLQVLCGAKWQVGKLLLPQSDSISRLNPDGTNFIVSLMGRTTLNDALLDPWGEPYHIAVDRNGDGKTTIRCEDNQARDTDLTSRRQTDVTVQLHVAVWSNGPNRKNECGYGDDLSNWD